MDFITDSSSVVSAGRDAEMGDGGERKRAGPSSPPHPRDEELKLLGFNILIIWAEGYGTFSPRKVVPAAWKRRVVTLTGRTDPPHPPTRQRSAGGTNQKNWQKNVSDRLDDC